MTDIRTVLKLENDDLRAENARLTAGSEAMQEDARNNTATISTMKELLIKAESALTYANWDGEFSKQATAQDVISARDAIRAYMKPK